MAADAERMVIDQDDLVERISALTTDAHQRLQLAARRLSAGLRIAPEDLLQKAFLHVLEGQRRCPGVVDIVTFMYGVMRSLASSERKSAYRHPEVELSEPEIAHPGLENPPNDCGDLDPAKLVVEEAAAQNLMRQLEEYFADDEDVQLLILSRVDGDTPAESKALLGKSDKGYATACKRLRRGYAKLTRKEES